MWHVTLSDAMLIVILLCAVATDLRHRRIPNRLIVAGLCGALLCALAGGGLIAAVAAIKGAAVGLLVLLPFFVVRLVGAGDVKLLSVVGGFTGVAALLPVVLGTFIAGGVLGMVWLVRDRSMNQMWGNLKLILLAAVMRLQGAQVMLSDFNLTTAARLPYALAMLGGVVSWMALR